MVVTDHDAISQLLRAAVLAPDYGLIGIPGAEITTPEGHLLALGVEELPTIGHPFAETVREVRDLGGVAIVPHPFQCSKHGAKAGAIVDCDGIEVYNAHAMTGLRNRRARTFALAQGYPSIGASDAHVVDAIGRAYTELRIESDRFDRESVLAAIRAGETAAFGRRTTLRQYLGTLATSLGYRSKRVGRRIGWGQPNR